LKAKNILCCVIAKRDKQQSAKVNKKKFVSNELAYGMPDKFAGRLIAG